MRLIIILVIELYSASCQLLLKHTVNSNFTDISISDLPTGLNLIRIHTLKGIETHKVLKQ